jgi:hypothetical protein
MNLARGSIAAAALVLIGLGAPGGAGAEAGACREEVRALCGDAASRREIRACLRERADALSTECAERAERVAARRHERRRACGGDAEALCGDTERGAGGVRRCLRENFERLSDESSRGAGPGGTARIRGTRGGTLTHDLTRENLAERTEEVLNRGSARNPDVLLVRTDGGRVVVKDFAPRSWLVRQTLGRWLTRREMRAYRALAGHPNVPRLCGAIDALAFAVEYRPGRRLTRSTFKILPSGFSEGLREAIEKLHERGVAHLDLSHRSNVLVSDASREPVLVDFGSAVCFEPGGVGSRILLPWLARLDYRALRKWRTKMERLEA